MPSRARPQGPAAPGSRKITAFFDVADPRPEGGSMLASESARTFEAMKDELIRSFPGQFALVCGARLVGVYSKMDEAMGAAARLFDDDALPQGTPILISEIALRASVRVLATPYKRAVAAVAR
jgi:hypothetical protein